MFAFFVKKERARLVTPVDVVIRERPAGGLCGVEQA